MCVYPNGGAGTEDAVVGSANRMLQGAIPTCSSLSFSSLQGFAERKLILVSEVVQACKKIHNDEIRKERLAALKTKQGPGAESRQYEPTRKTPEIKVQCKSAGHGRMNHWMQMPWCNVCVSLLLRNVGRAGVG
eukprot:921339-Pelagomonas_calceolata.AAC.1